MIKGLVMLNNVKNLKKIKTRIHHKYAKTLNTLNTEKDLKKLIDSKDVISFDIFDTVIVRKILSPSDIFRIVESIYKKKYGELSFNFSEIRSKAESKAKIKLDKICIGLSEIYEYIRSSYDLDIETINKLKLLEIDIELKLCTKNEYIFSFYQYCIECNKQIIFTSDMYLPETVIGEILHKNGYTKYHSLFVSSVIGKSKSQGAIYPHIINSLSCRASQILHIGDYFYADVINSSKFGITPYFYQKTSELGFKKNEFNILRKLYDKELSISDSIYFATIFNKHFTHRATKKEITSYEFGYTYCGILYLGYIKWLTKQVNEQGIKKVFFLARDGYMMHKIYNMINKSSHVPPSEYMYASRRAINIPTIQDSLDSFSMNILCNFIPNLNVEDYLNRVHLKADRHIEKIQRAGFIDKKHIIKTEDDKVKLATLFQSLSAEVCKNTAIERDVLVKYLDKIGFTKTEKIAIVDIGWRGTTQHSLEKLMSFMDKSPEIVGYYLGTFSKAKEFVDKGLAMSGYSCNLSLPKWNYDVLNNCVEMFEFIFSAPHGSVINFEENNGAIKPVFESANISAKKSQMISELQKGAEDFVRDFTEVEAATIEVDIDAKSALSPISRLLNSPTYNEAVYFGNLTHTEYIGTKNYDRYFAKVTEPWWALLNPIKTRKIYYSTVWKAGLKKRYLRL